MTALGVSVEELVRVLKEKRTRIPYEIGAFVVLEACEAVQARPIQLQAGEVRIGDDGRVSVDGQAPGARVADSARSVAKLLAYVLVAAGPGVPPALLDLVERGPSDGGWDLGRFRDELEAALVPLNRGAARRVLSRMLREAAGEFRSHRNSSRPPPQSHELDAELDGLLGGSANPDTKPMPRVEEEAPPPPPPPQNGGPETGAQPLYRPDDLVAASGAAKAPKVLRTPRGPESDTASDLDTELDALAEMLEPDPTGAHASEKPTAAASGNGAARPPRVGRLDSEEPTAPSSDLKDALGRDAAIADVAEQPTVPPRAPRSLRLDELEAFEPAAPRAGGKALAWAALFLLLTVGLVVGVLFFRPDVVDRAMGRETAEEREAREEDARALAEAAAAREAHRRRFGNLAVEVEPAEAQVLLFVGRGPATAENLPLGVAHEFIAVADDRSPTRALVPPSATWESTPDGPRYELAMQTGDEPMAFEELELGATRAVAGEMGAPTGERGTVRVITNPPGARVYLLVGFSPTVQVRNVRTDEPVELLLWREGFRPKRAAVLASDWRQDGEQPTAAVRVTLEASE